MYIERDSQRGLWTIIGIGMLAFSVSLLGDLLIDSQEVCFITEFGLTVFWLARV
jgi:hypothetical protein